MKACEEYKAASNAVLKTEIVDKFIIQQAEKQNFKVDGILGRVEEIGTYMGKYVQLTVSSPLGTFSNDDVLHQGALMNRGALKATNWGKRERLMKKGSALYKMVRVLGEGSSIKFSGELVVPPILVPSLNEEDTLCGDQWLTKYTKIEQQ